MISVSLKIITYAAVNGYFELTFLKGRQRFDATSTSNLEVYTFWDGWILTLLNFGHGGSLPCKIWSTVNLERTDVLFFYYFLYLESESWPRKKYQLGESSPNLIFVGVNLDPIVIKKKSELVVNLDLTILFKRWTEVKTWGWQVRDALWRVH